MSYEEKYLKYKSKYLALKVLKNNLQQLGGANINTKSIYEDNFLNLNSLTDTPNYYQDGGKSKHSKKGKKKSIYEDSDLDLNSSTDSMSISELHSLSSSDIDDI